MAHEHDHGQHHMDLPASDMDSDMMLHERVSADMKLIAQHQPFSPFSSSSSSSQPSSSSPHVMDHSMMPMMSLGLVKFPVAFFNIVDVWQFVLLVTACFLISFLTEFAKVRNALGSLSAVLENVLPRIIATKSPHQPKRYKSVALASQKIGTDGFGLRKPSLENISNAADELDAGSKTQLQKMAEDASNEPITVKKRRKLLRKQQQQRRTPLKMAMSMPVHHQKPINIHSAVPPSPGGPAVRIFQFVYHFTIVFSHYALMMAAMANLWAMMFVCAGAATGYMVGSWFNDRQASRLYRCQSCASAEDGRQSSPGSMVPRIKVESHDNDASHNGNNNNNNDDSSDDSSDSSSDSSDENNRKGGYYATTGDHGPTMRPIPTPLVSGPYCH